MLSPKRTKYRKAHKGRIHGVAKGGTDLNFGAYRPEGGRARPHHRAPDRGGAARHHAPHPPRRPRLDPHLPGRAGVAEAGRGAHGQRQGHARILGLPGEAGPHHVRARRRAARRRARGVRRWPRPSCRSAPASSRGWARRRSHEGGRRPGQDRRRAEGRARAARQGGVQPALPARERPAREHRRGCARCGATSRASRPCSASARAKAS